MCFDPIKNWRRLHRQWRKKKQEEEAKLAVSTLAHHKTSLFEVFQKWAAF
jgi:hypothetical protein